MGRFLKSVLQRLFNAKTAPQPALETPKPVVVATPPVQYDDDYSLHHRYYGSKAGNEAKP